MSTKITTTPAVDALHAFDAANNVEPARTIAERIARKYGAGPTHSMVDEISHVIEDARELGQLRGPLVEEAIKSLPLRPAGSADLYGVERAEE